MVKKTAIDYHAPAKPVKGGVEAKNAKNAPSPNMGQGTIPKGGPSTVTGQPALTTKK